MIIISILLSLSGLFVAYHIYRHKKSEIPLVCPIGFDCNAVVHSDYSTFLGARVEVLGILYYAFLTLSYIAVIFHPNPNVPLDYLSMASLAALLFSLYLIFVQAFILKKGCSWCLVSAGISILIYIFNVIAYGSFL